MFPWTQRYQPKPNKKSIPGYRKPEECYDPNRVSDRHRRLVLPPMTFAVPKYCDSFEVTANTSDCELAGRMRDVFEPHGPCPLRSMIWLQYPNTGLVVSGEVTP